MIELDICEVDNCGLPVVKSHGMVKADILLITDAPTEDDLKSGMPLTGEYAIALRQELSRVGIDFGSCRITCLWKHAKTKKSDKAHYDYFAGKLIGEASKYPVVLLFGSDVTELFLGYSATSSCGIVGKSNLIPSQVVMPCISILSTIAGGIGELRLCLKKFSKEYTKWKENKND